MSETERPRPRASDWGRVATVLALIGSLFAAAWYLDDRVRGQVMQESGRIEARLVRMEARWQRQLGDLATALQEVNGRLDRLLEMRLAGRDSALAGPAAGPAASPR